MNISLDFWNTICISNPEFAKARSILCKEFNIDLKSIQNYKSINLEAEKKGVHVNRKSFIENMDFIYYMNLLFLKYPPLPIYKNVFEDILKLKDTHNIFICSNTGLIHGITLHKFIWDVLEIPKQCK